MTKNRVLKLTIQKHITNMKIQNLKSRAIIDNEIKKQKKREQLKV